MATAPVPMPQGNTTPPPQPATQQQAPQTSPMPVAPSPNAPAAPTAAPAQQNNPAVTKVKDAAQKATKSLVSAAASLPHVVGAAVKQDQQEKQTRDKLIIKTVFDAHIASQQAQENLQKTQDGIKQIDQHMQEAQALPADDPSKSRKVAYLAQMHQAAVAHFKQLAGTLKQSQQTIQAVTAEKSNQKLLAKAFGYDEKAASTPERQIAVQLAQQAAMQIQGAEQKATQQAQNQPVPVSQPPASAQPEQAAQTPQSGANTTQAPTENQSGFGKRFLQFLGTIASGEHPEVIKGTPQYKAALQQKAIALQQELQKGQEEQAKIGLTKSQADYQEARAGGIEPWQEKQKDAQAKQAELDKKEAFLEKKALSPTAFHGKTGVMFDQSVPYGWTGPDGKQYTASDPDMPEQGKAAIHDANVAYERYQKMKSQTGAAAKERADAYYNNWLLHAQGVGPDGKPLPGMMQTDTGQTVGTAAQGNVRPTGTERTRADLASSAKEQMKSMEDLLTKRTDLFGPAAGRGTDFTVWLGSQDPDAQAFQASARIVADHLAGVFGGRSEAALDGIYKIIGQNKTNPKAAIAALNKLNEAATTIQKMGTVHTVGSSTDINKGKPSGKDDPLGLFK